MYHEAKAPYFRSYYDDAAEVPEKAKVFFPGKKEPVEMTAEEMIKLSDEGWYTIVHSVNYGCCDHWTSVPLSKWVKTRFQVVALTAAGKTFGYTRMEWNVHLTRDSSFWKSEVWNS